jgi:hypothetical protein
MPTAQSDSATRTRCPGCGALVADCDGNAQRYIGASPGCWAIYGKVLAREYSDAEYSRWNRLTVDTYAAQHPGTPSRQSIQSVNVHLLGMYAVLELGQSSAQAMKLMERALSHAEDLQWLEPPPSMGAITIVDVHAAKDAQHHGKIVREWAESVWNAWQPHHEAVRESCRKLERPKGSQKPAASS